MAVQSRGAGRQRGVRVLRPSAADRQWQRLAGAGGRISGLMDRTWPRRRYLPRVNGMADDFAYMTALDLLRLIRTKQASPVAIVESALARAEASQPILNPFVTVTADLAMDAARAAEKAVMAGEDEGLLTGLPLSIKDLTAVKGVRFTSGSRTLADFIAPHDSPASERVKAQGAAIVGKTTTTEFGCKASSDSPLTGVTRNPWNLDKTTGGSSAGAGASVAAGITPFALGTDGGGSIRIPSSFCGLFGIKAQFGRVPVFPAAATATLAHVRPPAAAAGHADADARPCRPAGAHGARRCAAAHDHFRLRRARPGRRCGRGPGLSWRLRAIAQGTAHRLEPHARLCPADQGGARDHRQGRAR